MFQACYFEHLFVVLICITDFCKVVKYWPAKGKSGFLVWRYLLKRDDDEPAPWTRDGKERIKKLGLTMQVKMIRLHYTNKGFVVYIKSQYLVFNGVKMSSAPNYIHNGFQSPR